MSRQKEKILKKLDTLTMLYAIKYLEVCGYSFDLQRQCYKKKR